MKHQEDLHAFIGTIQNSELNNQLEGVLLYGKHHKKKNYDSPNFNLLFVFKKLDVNNLDALSALFEKETNIEIDPFILTLDELQKSADVYPIKFMDISENHKVLLGADPFDQVVVHKDNLRLRAEQELRNLALRLRFIYVKGEGDLRAVRFETKKSIYPLMNNLEVLIMLKKDKIINEYDQLLSLASSELKIDTTILSSFLKWNESEMEISDTEFKTAFQSYQKVLDQLIQIVDSH